MSKIDFSKMTTKNIDMYLQKIKESKPSISNINFEYFKEQKNLLEEQIFKSQESAFSDILYPNFNDPNFNKKIFKKKEFHDLEVQKYKGSVEENIDKICDAEFELAPHQIFVRNYLSFLTPYNSLLLYHGLGTGKTCSAISVCEEMRQYMKQVGIHKKIIIVASPNVQQNFKSQLFDERKLKDMDGLWNLKGCTGTTFLKEINPMNMKGLHKEKIVKQIKKIINQYYIFMGYTEFSNYITKIKNKYLDKAQENTEKGKGIRYKSIQKEFSNRLIVIDEVHNIRISSDNPKKTTAENLLELVKYSSTLKLLLLSATPMFNSAREIVWLTNLMNINDNRPPIEIKDVFDKNGSLKITDGKETGKELLMRKMRGYVSFLRGENPFSFPYRIYPKEYKIKNSIKHKDFNYPRYQINRNVILEGIQHLDLYLTSLGSTQKVAYNMAVKEIKKNLPNEDEISVEGTKGMGWKQIGVPLQTLNMVYPSSAIDEFKKLTNSEKENSKLLANNFVGSEGLYSVMDSNRNTKHDFTYKQKTLENYGRIFSQKELSKYSGKIHEIIKNIKKSSGIVLIYSQYIDSGCVPIALALEEAGITRYSGASSAKPLFNDDIIKDIEPIDSLTMNTKKEFDSLKTKKHDFNQASYVLITGDKKLSPNNRKDVKAVTNDTNKNGKDVKVVIISEAGSEGIDFNNIRQVHILEPWYNMSRIEQIIGRAVRFKSHCKQPIEKRNVEIYLYGSNPIKDDNIEPLDLYIYRLAEQKALQIGVVSRILKQNSVDCLLNSNVNALTTDELNTTFSMKLSSGKEIKYRVGDKAFTQICDYMENCDYKCIPDVDKDDVDVNIDTYNKEFILLNTEKIIQRIKDIFKEKFVYSKEDLIKYITYTKNYPLIQIDSALQYLIDEQTEYLTDMFGRLGNLVNIDNYYMFQPIELTDNKISMYRRKKPVEYKHDNLNVKLDKELKTYILKGVDDKKKTEKEKIIKNTSEKILTKIKNTYEKRLVKKEIKRGIKDKDVFYMHALDILANLTTEKIDTFKKFIIHSIIDRLQFQDKKNIIEYFYLNKPSNDMENIIQEYIKKYMEIDLNTIKGFLLSSEQTKTQLWFFDEKDKTLNKAEPTDLMEHKDKLLDLRYDNKDLNIMIGFISYIKKINENVFKTKNTTLKKNPGARCDQSGKKNVVKVLNQLLDKDIFTIENTKGMKIEIFCILQEMIARYYQDIRKNNKIWFLNLEQALWNELEKVKNKT